MQVAAYNVNIVLLILPKVQRRWLVVSNGPCISQLAIFQHCYQRKIGPSRDGNEITSQRTHTSYDTMILSVACFPTACTTYVVQLRLSNDAHAPPRDRCNQCIANVVFGSGSVLWWNKSYNLVQKLELPNDCVDRRAACLYTCVQSVYSTAQHNQNEYQGLGVVYLESMYPHTSHMVSPHHA